MKKPRGRRERRAWPPPKRGGGRDERRGTGADRAHLRGTDLPQHHGADQPRRGGSRRRPTAEGSLSQRTAAEPRRDTVHERVLAESLRRDEPLRAGEWLWTTREGAERDLLEELLREPSAALAPRRLAPALVASAGAPHTQADARLHVTFARQAFQVARVCEADTPQALAAELAPAFCAALEGERRYGLHVFVPDSEAGNPLAPRAEALAAALAAPAGTERLSESELRRHGGRLIQVCLLRPNLAAIGGMDSQRALSLWPGGRARMKLPAEAPSRAARKLAEAFAWLGMAPGSGELCVDLGAAPGGWTWLLLERKARVIAVDPARMDAKLMKHPLMRHVQGSAFEFTPDEPVDWLFCDMVWRPLEVAQMLGRWARRRLTHTLVANFKLPMKRKLEMLERVRDLLRASGYSGVRTRQLYHDRDEITLTAHVR